MPNGKRPSAADVELKRRLSGQASEILQQMREITSRPDSTDPVNADLVNASRAERVDRLADERLAILKEIDANLRQFETEEGSQGPIETRLKIFFKKYGGDGGGGGGGGEGDADGDGGITLEPPDIEAENLATKKKWLEDFSAVVSKLKGLTYGSAGYEQVYADEFTPLFNQILGGLHGMDHPPPGNQVNAEGLYVGSYADMILWLSQAIVAETPSGIAPTHGEMVETPPPPPPPAKIGAGVTLQPPPGPVKSPKEQVAELQAWVGANCEFTPPLSPSEKKTIADAAGGRTELGPTQLKRLRERLKQPCPPRTTAGIVAPGGTRDLVAVAAAGAAVRMAVGQDQQAGARARARGAASVSVHPRGIGGTVRLI